MTPTSFVGVGRTATESNLHIYTTGIVLTWVGYFRLIRINMCNAIIAISYP